MTASHRYWAFISHSSEDRHWAEWLQRSLETWSVPARLRGTETPAGPAPARFRPVFRDRNELSAGADLESQIADALAASAWMIVICSPAAAASVWVNKEIARFLELHGPGRVLALIVEGNPRVDYRSCFPQALLADPDGDGPLQPLEPIAADLRPGRDGRRMGLLKILAGMLGVGLDDLIQRDQQRRQRRLVMVTAASVAGMAITGGLALAALQARNEAQAQRAQAEGLVEYMLGDLRQRLEPSGRLDVMDGIGRRTLAYYARQKVDRLDAASLSRRARALRLMGQIAVKRGHLDEAARSFAQASATTAEILSRAPDDVRRLFEHAQDIYWVGYVDWQRGQLPRAEQRFAEYLTLAQRLKALDPANDDWRAEEEYAWSDLGSVYLEQGDAARAEAAHLHALAVAEELARRKPDDPSRMMDLASERSWLSQAAEVQGRPQEARAQRLEEIAICNATLQKDHSYQEARFSTIVALRALGRLEATAGRPLAAVGYYRDAARRSETLLAGQPDDMDVAAAAAIAYVELGESLLQAGRPAEAESARHRAQALLDVATAQDRTVANWRRYQIQTRLLEASLALDQGRADEALALDARSLAAAAREPLGGPNTYPRWLLNRARLQAGEDLAALGQAAAARSLWADIVSGLDGPTEEYEPRLLRLLEAANHHLGRLDASRDIRRRLQRIGGTQA